MNLAGAETILHEFNWYDSTPADGANPYAGLIPDSAGNLYGTTEGGGTYGNGTVFKLTPSGTETVLYSFTGAADGGLPIGGLVLDSAGNLYGTTSDSGVGPWGTVFKVSPSGAETVLYSFTGGRDGGVSWAGLVRDASGNLYGTTTIGGSHHGEAGYGVVFKVDTTGKETVLHSFAGGPTDGANPYGPLLNLGGYLYGTTRSGGAFGAGVVFRVAK